MNSQCRHQRRTMGRVNEYVRGTKGSAGPGVIYDNDGKVVWRYERAPGVKSACQIEHDELYKHIREDNPLNNAHYAAHSTMSAIFGRMATYSGKLLKLQKAQDSEIALVPEKLGWDIQSGPQAGSDGLYPCAIPGKTKVY